MKEVKKENIEKKVEKKNKKKVKVTFEYGLNVRKEPSPNAEVVEVMPKGTNLTITEETDGYGFIGSGWVLLEFTK